MSSTVLSLAFFIMCFHYGFSNTSNGNFPAFINRKNTVSPRFQQQPSGIATLSDIFLLKSLSELDIDLDAGEQSFYIDPFLTGNTSPWRSPRSQSRSQSTVTRTKSKLHKPHNSKGGTTFATLFCAYCLQFGFNLCVQRFCFGPLT